MNDQSKAGVAMLVLAAGIIASAPVLAEGQRGHGRVGAGVHRGAPAPLAHGHAHGRYHGGVRFGLYLGAPLLWGGYYTPSPYSYYYPAPLPYYPPVVTVPVPPQSYIEQGPAGAPAPAEAPTAPQPGYWYYCSDAQAYYPYVKECPGGWQRVSPQPPQG